jgi:hypothetical protein
VRSDLATGRATLIVAALLFVPAVLAAVSRPVGLAASALAVLALVYLGVKSER